MSAGIEIVNGQEVELWLKTETMKVSKIGWEAVASTGLKVMDSMKRYILPAVVTGRLRASVHVESLGSSSNQYSDDEGGSYNGKFNASPKDGEVYVGTNVEYADDANEHSRAARYFERAVTDGEVYMDKYLKREAKK